MELSTLRFIVETKDLEEAAKKIDALGVSVSKLNKPMQAMSTESAKANKELSKAEESAAKAALAQLKLEQAQNKSTQATRKSISVSERQTLILKYQAEGNSKGQASILATAKAAGALDDEMLKLTRTLNLQRTLMGTEPFDNSIGLHQKLQNQTKITDEVTNLFNRSLGLTEKQMVDLAREKQRLIALYGIEGKSLAGLDAEYEQIVQMSRQITQSNDARTKSMKDQIKVESDATKANAYLAKEMERVNRLNGESESITSATNNRLIKFEQALKLSGDTAAQQSAKLATYRKELLATQAAAGNRQVDYLSRALGPQITDIFVGLATGQSPLMVMLQQGGQLRDQFALAGVAGAEMGAMLAKATIGMAGSVKDVAIAVGSALGGAFIATGKAVNTFIGDTTRLNSTLEYLRYQIALADGSSGSLMRTFKATGFALQILTGAIVVGAVAGLIAYGVAIKQVIAEESALSKAINLTGASLGLTTNSALALSEELAGSKGNIGSYVTAITDIAKAGGITSDNLKTVATTIVEVSKITGISSETLAKNFSKIAEKPLEALIPFAKELGTINVETLKQIQNLIKAGKETEAVKLATDEYAKALKGVSATIKEDMGAIETIFYGVGSAAKSMWNEILNIGRKGTLENQMKDAVASLIEAQKGKSWYSRFGRTNEEEVKYYEEIVQSLGRQINAQKELGDVKAKNSADVKKFEADEKKKDKTKKADKKELTELEKERLQFLKVISDIEDKASGFTKQYSDQLNILNIALTEGWLSQDEFNMKLQELNSIQPAVIKAHKDHADAINKANEAQKKADDIVADAWANMEQLNKQVLDQTQLLELEGSLIGATAAERKKALGIKRLDLKLEEEIAAIKKRALPEAEQEDQINQARQRRLANEKNLNTEIAIDAATKTLEEYNKIADGVTDSIVTALIEGGESGGKKLRSILEAELRRPITVFVRAIVDSLTGGATGAAASAGGNFLSSMGGSLLSSTLGSISVGGGSLAAAGSAFGTGFMTTLQGGSIAEAAGIYSAAGMQGVSTGLSAGASLAGYVPQIAIALAVANALGLFRSTKQVGGGISGTLGGTGSVDQYGLMRKSGTLFNGPSYFRQNQGTFAGNDALQQTFDQLKASTKAMADTLKLSSTGIEDFTKVIDISFDGLTDAQRQEKLASVFQSVNDELAALVLGAGATAEQLSTLYNNVMQQRYDLETQLLELQGKTLELRERERAKIYDVNKGLFDQIKALEDQKAKTEAAAVAMEKLTSVTTTIVDEINRLRGVSTSQAGLESQFAILTAQIRSSDDINIKMNALAQLPEVTKGLEQIAASSAVNATDIIFARARLAQSLQDTLGYFPAGTLSTATTSVATLPSVATASAGASVSSASSNQELLAALVIEVQGLRAEVRADVSHNAKTAKILERVNQDGESLTVTALV